MISLVSYEVTELYGTWRKLIWMFLDRPGCKYFLKDQSNNQVMSFWSTLVFFKCHEYC